VPIRPELEATTVKRAVEYGLRHRAGPPVHVIGIDEVSRGKGQVYLTLIYDLERPVLLWVGEDRAEEAVRKFFAAEMGRRRCHTLQVVCMDMWAPYAILVRQHALNAQILFDRFHIVKHLKEALEEVRRSEMRLSAKERVVFKRRRWLLLKNPWNLKLGKKDRPSTLVQWNPPIVRAYYLKEVFQLSRDYKQPAPAKAHLQKWMHPAMRRAWNIQEIRAVLRGNLDGILPWTTLRLFNGAVEGMNNKIKSISDRSFGFRSATNLVAAIYHCHPRPPVER
jgi:transposase